MQIYRDQQLWANDFLQKHELTLEFAETYERARVALELRKLELLAAIADNLNALITDGY